MASQLQTFAPPTSEDLMPLFIDGQENKLCHSCPCPKHSDYSPPPHPPPGSWGGMKRKLTEVQKEKELQKCQNRKGGEGPSYSGL